MKKILILGIFIILFTNLIYAVADSLDVADSTFNITKRIKDTRNEKGAFGFSSGKVLGTGWTVRVKFNKVGIQGSFLVVPSISSETGNEYCFGLACSYDIISIPYFRLYLSTGTSCFISCHDERTWFIGLAPIIDFSIPYFKSVSFNFGYSASYVVEQLYQKHNHTYKFKPEFGFYFRIF